MGVHYESGNPSTLIDRRKRMPNWVFNYLSAEGDRESIEKLKEQLNKPVTYKIERMKFDEEKREWTTGIEEVTWSKPVISFMNIVAPTDWDAYAKQQDRDNGITLEDPLWWPKTLEWSKTQNDWYNWNNNNWGTKWDVAVADDEQYPDTEMYQDEPTAVGYKFNTAWAPPTPVIQKLSEQYPNLTFTLSFEEEQGWGGEATYKNGVETITEDYDNKCRDCDAINTVEYCEDCQIDVCSKCMDFSEANPDDVKTCEKHGKVAVL